MSTMMKRARQAFAGSALALGIALAFGAGPAQAQANSLVWEFKADAGAAPTLRYHIPSAQYVQVKASCGQPGTVAMLVAADTGLIPDGGRTALEVFGSGQNYSFPATVTTSGQDENIYGVRLTLPAGHPFWRAMQGVPSLDYRVQQYVPGRMELAQGKAAIGAFTAACAAAAAAPAPSAAAPAAGGTQSAGTSGGLTEKSAFEFARQMDTPEAYQAFIKVYPNSFFAEIAKGMLAKKQGQAAASAQPAPQPQAPAAPQQPQVAVVQPAAPKVAALDAYMAPAGSSAWRTGDYVFGASNAKAFSARVLGQGVEFVTYCSADRKLQAVIRKADQSYPKFNERVAQAIAANPNFSFRTSNGATYEFPVAHYKADDEFGVSRGIDPNGPFIRDLIKESSFTVTGGPFGASFQLKQSKNAICRVTSQCGVQVAACGGAGRSVAPAASASSQGAAPQRCRPRSTYVAGRGCILNRYLNNAQRAAAPRRTQRAASSVNKGEREQRCFDLWYSRNQIFKDANYCFRTAKARNAFGNSANCTRSPRLSASQRRRVAQIKREESRYCR